MSLPNTPKLHKKHAPLDLTISMAIVSTSRYEELQAGALTSDKTFPIVEGVLVNYPHFHLAEKKVLPDDPGYIRNFISQRVNDRTKGVDAIILSGGTGISAKDHTVESIKPLFDKELLGFGELFRQLSYDQIGSAAIMSRATAGIVKETPIFCIPGSPKAVKLALDKIILPELSHICYELRKE